ncbi:hypothetical protein Scep_000473 [Stephania cephalantha]|uniref:Serpin domain-containing protein n=1 Tax=Stephania cephalantha TaxID=152367 RepID=A0AAP0L655_9MAGN
MGTWRNQDPTPPPQRGSIKGSQLQLKLKLLLVSSLPTKTMDMKEVITQQTHLSLQLTKRVLSDEAKESNLVFSPLSIHVVLSLIAAGSSGQTLDQLLSFLGSKTINHLNSFASELVSLVLADGSVGGGPRLSFANSVWIEKSLPIKPSFTEVVQNLYKAAAKPVDFQTKESTKRNEENVVVVLCLENDHVYSGLPSLSYFTFANRVFVIVVSGNYIAVEVTNDVNSWAESETGGLIKEVLPSGSVDSSTRLILANALYFKGSWDEKFEASSTKEHDFHLLDGSSVQVPFMTSEKKQYIGAFDGFKVLGLPYKQGEDKRHFFMYFYLPDAKDGLHSLVEKLGSEPGFLDHHLPRQKVAVEEFRIPKFKITFGFEGSNVLKSLGLNLPFSGGEGLTEMVDSPVGRNLYVSGIFHKAFIEVDEEGTEAAAATAGVVALRSLPVTMDFVADHPFLFLIREGKTGAVLFIGHVLNPAQGT